MQSEGPVIQLPGSFNKVSLYYQGLPSRVKRMVAGLSFDGIIALFTYGSYTPSQAALVERWMDTTHTFHLPFGEMIVTPLDFTAITGLSFSREPVPFSGEACESAAARRMWLKDLFGAVASVKSGSSTLLRYTQLVNRVRSGYDVGCVSSEQLARCFLFYLLSAVIFPNASGTGYLRLLPILRDLRSLSRYSWGTIAFAYMYSGLDLACRGRSRICSCLFVLDVSVISCLLVLTVFRSRRS